MEPASIRYNNPGAMWGNNALTKKWGDRGAVGLHDGLGQGNNIANFPSRVMGAAAQFDLWKTSARYHNKQLAEAIHTWSGGNYTTSYLDFLKKRVPGLTDTTVMDDAFLSGPRGVEFMKAQAWHEAGKPYPMTDAEWRQAQDMVFHGAKAPQTTKKIVAPTIVAATTAGTAQAVSNSGHSGWWVFLVIVVGLALAGGAFYYFHRKDV